MENDDTIDIQRVWKEFVKHTDAGKLLYNIYGVNIVQKIILNIQN